MAKRVCHYCGKGPYKKELGPLRLRKLDFMANFTGLEQTKLLTHKRCARVHGALPQVIALAFMLAGGLVGFFEFGSTEGVMAGVAAGAIPAIFPMFYFFYRLETPAKTVPEKATPAR